MKVRVEQGPVHVNHGWQVWKHADGAFLEFDLRAKYAKVYAIAGSVVHLGVGEDTLHTDKHNGFTSVHFEDLPKGWTVLFAEVSRYTFRVVIGAYGREGNNFECIFED